MKVRILDSASQDLVDGFHFYEKQDWVLVIILLTLCFLISTPYRFTRGFIQPSLISTIGCLQSGFHSLSTIR